MAHPLLPQEARSLYRSAWQDIEDTDKVFLITWNPKPRFYNYDAHAYTGNGYNDFEMQWRTMLDKLIQANRCLSKYAFVAELSDVGKLHMHGFMVVNDKVKFYKSFIPTLRVNGFIKMPKANSHKWKTFKYHVKDLASTYTFIKENDYVLTHENRKAIARDLTLYKALVAHQYDEKQIKKKNIMDMIMDFESDNSDTE